MLRSNRHKLQRLGNNTPEGARSNTLTHDFNILLKCLLLAGLVFPSLSAKRRRPSWYSKIFEMSYNLFGVFIIVINIFFWQRRYSSVTLHFSTSLTLLLAISLRFVVYWCRKKIPQMAKNLIQLYDDIHYGARYQSFRLHIAAGCVLTLALTVVTSVLDSYHLQAERAKQRHSIQFMFKLNQNGYQIWVYYIFMFLGPVKMYFAYGISVVIFTFCCVVYAIVKRIVATLDQRIKMQNGFTKFTVRDYLCLYNRLCRVVAETDEVLSPCVLLLYGLMVSGQFYALTVLISSDTAPRSFITALQNIIVFLLTTVAFLTVTLTASKVTERTEDVKRSLQKLAEEVTHASDFMTNNNVSNSYIILISILGGSQLCFTGWRMFNINRSFILTTMGVMISYGVIIVQLGRKSNI